MKKYFMFLCLFQENASALQMSYNKLLVKKKLTALTLQCVIVCLCVSYFAMSSCLCHLNKHDAGSVLFISLAIIILVIFVQLTYDSHLSEKKQGHTFTLLIVNHMCRHPPTMIAT